MASCFWTDWELQQTQFDATQKQQIIENEAKKGFPQNINKFVLSVGAAFRKSFSCPRLVLGLS